MELAIYDLSGIQSFIFATNKLKEIIGGSKIVSKALFENIPDMLRQEHDAWKDEKFSFGNEDKAKIVYIGGGNALMVFSDEDEFNAFTDELSEKVFFQSGGSIRLCSASIKLDEKKTFAENQKILMEKLNNEKKIMGNLQPSLCAPFVAYDNNNYEALVYNNGECLTRSRKSKITAYADQKKAFKEFIPNGKGFASQFEDFAKDDEKNYLAIIHIDGNTMGIKIREFSECLKGDVISSFDEMKKLSVAISNLYRGVLKETVETIFKDYNGDVLPIRPIVADGDDITVMINSHYAFKFVECFFENLNNKQVAGLEGFVPTAAAGVVFCKIKFPFTDAYDLAEECCKNAKSETRKRMGTEKSYNSIDYQMIYSGVNESLEQTRKELYEIADSSDTAHLIRRPYIFDDTSDYSYKKFDEVAKEIIKMLKEKSVARTKLKGLRNAYGNGKTETEYYLEYIKSHTKTDKEKAAVQTISNIFTEKNEAVLFDFLDIMDIAWEEAEKDE